MPHNENAMKLNLYADRFNRDRTVWCSRELIGMMLAGEPLFDRLLLPEHEFLPKWVAKGSRKHALFLFFAAWLSRRGNSATELYRLSARLITLHPWLIDPAHPRSQSPRNRRILRQLLPRGNNTKFGDPVEWWLDALRILREKYGSDPRKIFEGLPVGEGWQEVKAELLRRHDEFQGIGPKITALNVGQFMREVFTEDTPYWNTVRNVPFFTADSHTLRFMRMYGLITQWKSDKVKKLAPVVSEYVSQLCIEEGISPTHLFQAMWLVGAKVCDRMRQQPDQQRARAYCHACCPAVPFCLGVVPVHTLLATDPSERTRYLAHLRFDEFRPHADLVP